MDGFSLAPDVDLRGLTTLGFFEAFEIAPSLLVDGVGTFASRYLPEGACLGRIARQYTPRYFNDYPVCARVNHGLDANVVFQYVLDAQDPMLHLFALTSTDIYKGIEMLANYWNGPTPNFLDTSDSWQFRKMVPKQLGISTQRYADREIML